MFLFVFLPLKNRKLNISTTLYKCNILNICTRTQFTHSSIQIAQCLHWFFSCNYYYSGFYIKPLVYLVALLEFLIRITTCFLLKMCVSTPTQAVLILESIRQFIFRRFFGNEGGFKNNLQMSVSFVNLLFTQKFIKYILRYGYYLFTNSAVIDTIQTIN